MSGEGREWAVSAAAGLAALEVLVLGAVLWARAGTAAPLLIAFLAVKLPFCLGLRGLRPGAWLALLLWELAGVVAAAAAPDVPVILRLVELALAAGVLALLAASLPLFPRMELPER